jgi:hypothetical protein
MSSPFIYERPIESEGLIGRRSELSRLHERAMDGRNSRLEGPRRFGKTSLIRAVLDAASRDGAIVIEVNFLGCVSARDVAERIDAAYRGQLDGPVRRRLDGVLRTLRPTMSVAPAGVGVSAEPQPSQPALLERLALPKRIQERTGRPCVIAFDEFQEVYRVDPSLPGVFRSELESRGHAAAYLFSGSHPGMMRDLFADRRHAFFAQATPVELRPLPPLELSDFIVERFAQGRRDPGEALGLLLDAAEGHPQRAMLLAHHLYEQTGVRAAADAETWVAALALARRAVQGELAIVWDRCSDLERRVLKTVAQRTVALGSREAATRFGLGKGGSTQLAVNRLVGDGTLVADETTRTGWRVVDPLLAAWLRGE